MVAMTPRQTLLMRFMNQDATHERKLALIKPMRLPRRTPKLASTSYGGPH